MCDGWLTEWSTEHNFRLNTIEHNNNWLNVEQVIADRRQELSSIQRQTAGGTSPEDMVDKLTAAVEDNNIYTGRRRRRLAFVDMLLMSEESLSDQAVQEEVDTFMFEVSGRRSDNWFTCDGWLAMKLNQLLFVFSFYSKIPHNNRID